MKMNSVQVYDQSLNGLGTCHVVDRYEGFSLVFVIFGYGKARRSDWRMRPTRRKVLYD